MAADQITSASPAASAPGQLSHAARARVTTPRSTILLSAILAFAYAITLAFLPVYAFMDRENYLGYAESSDVILERNFISGWITTFSNEPVWLIVNIQLRNFLSSPDTIRTVIFISAFITIFILILKNRKFLLWIVFLALTPAFLTFYIVHLRQGLAVAVFLIGFYSKNKITKFSFYAFSPLIHSSFFFTVALNFLSWFSRRKKLSLKFVLPSNIIIFMGLAFALHTIASGLGARQSGSYEVLSTDVSGLGFVVWLSVLILFLTSGRSFLQNHLFSVMSITFYLSVYFVTPVAGRIFGNSLIFVFLSGLSLPRSRRYYFLAIVVLFSLISYGLRIGQPWLGFGLV